MIKGNPVSKGIAIGNVYIYKPYKADVKQSSISESQTEGCCILFEELRIQAKAELEKIRQRMEKETPEKAKIFSAHIDILYDEAIEEEIKDAVKYDLSSLDWAIYSVFNKYCKLLSKVSDVRMQERVADLKDVCLRLLRIYYKAPERDLSTLSQPVILVAEDLLPSDTAALNRNNVLAIVIEKGGATSHSAIIAKSYGIPALLGAKGVLSKLHGGQKVIVDALKGELYTEFTSKELEGFERIKAEFYKEFQDTQKYLVPPCSTGSGEAISILLNIGTANDLELAAEPYTDGVGLFRSEFLYMGRYTLPSEEEQYQIYKKVLLAFRGKPVTLRTLDIGGDKKLDCLQLPKEENPFLGNRGLRLCFSNPDIFKTQLRAALRSSEHGELWIMFPMVSSLDDIQKAKEAVKQAEKELKAEGRLTSPHYKLGVMIETPSIAILADKVAQEVDFASIGTNDLCQYVTAVDRMNQNLSEYYQNYHPAMMRMLYYIIREFCQAKKPISICGELGGDPLMAPALIGMGIRKLSMGSANLASIKKVISNTVSSNAQLLVQQLLQCKTQYEIKSLLMEFQDNLLNGR